MTLDKAIDIAHSLRDFPKKTGNPPTSAEALCVIEERLKDCRFNWLTGQEARDTLRQAIAGGE